MKIIKNIKKIVLVSAFLISNVFAQEFWTKLPGPEGGWIYSSAIDKTGGSNNGTIFIGTRGGGIFRSTDNGNTWQEINEGLEGFFVHDIVVGTSVFAATSNGIYRSDDNGNSWQLKEYGTSGGSWRAIYIDQSENVYAGHNGGGVYYSTDNGENWIGIGAGLTDGRVRTITKNNAGELFVGGFNGVHRSDDNGANWSHLSNGMPFEIVYDMLFFQNGPDENVLAITWDGNIYKSVNNGDLWQLNNGGIPQRTLYDIFINSTDNLFIGTNNGVFKSNDFGDNWISSGLAGNDVSAILENSSNEIISGTNQGNFISQDNGSSWNLNNTNFISGPIFDIDMNTGNDIFVIRQKSLDASFDNGINWTRKVNGLNDTTYWDIRINDAGNIFIGTADGIYRSDDNGDNWVFKGLAGYRVQQIDFNNMGHVFAGTDSYLFRSEDNGETWIELSNLNLNEIYALSINQNDNTIFAGHWQNGIYRSTDNGDTWTNVNNNLQDSSIQDIAVSHDGHVFVGTFYSGVMRSSDNGGNWTQVSTGLTDLDILQIAINPIGYLFIGCQNDGIWFSNNNGDNWYPLNSGMPYPVVYDFDFDNNNNIFTTTGGGIFRSTIPTILPNPTLLLPSDGAIDIQVNPTFEWNTVIGAETYHLQVSTLSDFSSIFYDQSGINNASHQVSGLNGNLTYYWRIRAENFMGGSDWSNPWSFTTYQLPIFTVQNATNITDISATLNGEVNPNGHNLIVGFEWGEDNSYGNYEPATPETFSGTTNQFVYAELNWLHTDRDYYFRVVVRQADDQFTVYGIDQMFHTQPYTTAIDIYFDQTFPTFNNPEDYGEEHYRIFGLPGRNDSQLDISNILSGEPGIAWQAYWDNGNYNDNKEHYLIAHDGSNNFRLGDGKAIWLVNKGDFIVNISDLPTMPLDGEDYARIPIHNGWNLITCPFLKAVPWWDIQQANSISDSLWEFTGGWNISDNLRPYHGFIFDNTTNKSELLIPYSGMVPTTLIKNEFNWRIKIVLQQNEMIDNTSYLGVSEMANKNKDQFDYRKPRAIGSIPSVYFKRDDWEDAKSNYATDIRPPITGIEKWLFTVHSKRGESAKLILNEIGEIPEKYEVVLLDKVNSKFLDLRKTDSYSFKPVTKITNFEVIVGKKEYVDLEISNIIPSEFSIGKNFPNPFNPSTTIPVSVPETSDLTLRVYNVLGQEIKTVFNGSIEAGRHYFKWDGTNYLNQQVAAGIYLYRMNTNKGHTFVGKMVLVK